MMPAQRLNLWKAVVILALIAPAWLPFPLEWGLLAAICQIWLVIGAMMLLLATTPGDAIKLPERRSWIILIAGSIWLTLTLSGLHVINWWVALAVVLLIVAAAGLTSSLQFTAWSQKKISLSPWIGVSALWSPAFPLLLRYGWTNETIAILSASAILMFGISSWRLHKPGGRRHTLGLALIAFYLAGFFFMFKVFGIGAPLPG